MQFGHFDDANKEYVITRPDTPRPWSNYLGSTEYGAIITNNAGGYSFYKSAAQGRFTRLRFNSVPLDQPGRYIYLRDREDGDYWSGAWQPVGKPLGVYKSECRHGSAYTIISSEYAQIRSEVTYFVPLGRSFECWRVRLSNLSARPRSLSAFTYVEYAGNWSAFDDLINLQYSQHIVRMSVEDGIIDHGTNVNIPQMPDNFEEKDQGRHTFLALVGAEVTGYDTDRTAFLGSYGSYARPAVVERGECTGSLAAGDNGCGVLESLIRLEPGETKEFLVLMGVGRAGEEGRRAVEEFAAPQKVDQELAALKSYWHARIGGLAVDTPDAEFNSMLNMWSPLNCLMTYSWSRAASLIYAGERDGLGFRDTVQDMLGVMHAIPAEAVRRLELMITGQVSSGGAMPVVKQFAHRPGSERPPREEEYRSDDCLWLFNAVPALVGETGNIAFYSKSLPYADSGEATVLGHLRRALEFNLERRGAHGLPCGLSADWNDCLRLGYRGESLFVAFQLRLGLSVYADVAQGLGKPEESAWAIGRREELDEAIQDCAWDGKWFIWAIGEDGTVYGTKDGDEGQVYLNTQVWALLSGAATGEQAELAMRAVKERLATPFGLMLCAPPFAKTSVEVMRAVVFNPGVKENAGIFNHTQGWGVMAETMLGRGDAAYEYCKASLPAAYNDRAEIRQMEPYVQGQTTYSAFSPRAGNSRTAWLSGAAAWSYYSLTQYILGIRPEAEGLRLDPCIPSAWKGFKAERRFRGVMVRIEVRNPRGVCKGVRELELNGEALSGNLVPAAMLKEENLVILTLG